jgi:crotonobetaine/carnitine-CoA ligase
MRSAPRSADPMAEIDAERRWNAQSIAQILRARATTMGSAPFLKCGGEWLSYADVDHRSDEVAAGLTYLGVTRGDRVALLAASRPEVVDLLFACAKIGAVFVPLNSYLKGQFLEHQLRDCEASVAVVDEPGLRACLPVVGDTSVKRLVLLDGSEDPPDGPECVDYAALRSQPQPPPAIDVAPRELAIIVYTSGTTGLPKGCMLPDGYLTQLPRAQRDAGWLLPGDRLITAFPLFHISGISTVLSALCNEASVCVEAEFSASSFLSRAKDEQATVAYGVGPMAMAILAQPPSPSDAAHALRLALWVPLHPDAQVEFEERFNTPVLSEAYGQTEVSPLALNSIDGDRNRASGGRAVPYLELQILDDQGYAVPIGAAGEIVVRPTHPDVEFFLGYWGRPDETAEAFRGLWYHTGDLGHLDAAGFVTFVDRKKDALRRRGENVASFELEMAISRHPAIAQAAATAVPSALGEDDIKVTLVCHPGQSPTVDDLFAFFKEQLPYFAIPRYVEIRDAMPTTATGRVQKYLLRDQGVTAGTWDLEALGLAVPKDQRRGA